MRIPTFLAAVTVAFTAAAQSLYNEPTAQQVTRLIGAVREAGGESGAYTAAVARAEKSLYGNARPTYAQIETLIDAVRGSGSGGDEAAATNAAQIAGLSGAVSANSAKISDLEAGVATVATQVDTVTDAVAGLGSSIAALETDVQTNAARIAELSGKADKVSNPTNGNFVAVNADGSLRDSGKKASSFVPATGSSVKIGTGASVGDVPSYGADGVAIGKGATVAARASGGVAIGKGAQAGMAGASDTSGSVAIGSGSDPSKTTGGAQALAKTSIAIGPNAIVDNVATGACQIGYASTPNTVPFSLRFRKTTVVDRDGKIPSSSLALDTDVVQDSQNPVSGGAVYSAIAAIPAPDFTTNNQDLVTLVTRLVPSNSPVASVNGKTGEVAIAAADVGAYDRSETDRKFDTYKPMTVWAAGSQYVHNATGELFKCDIVNSKWTTGTTVYSFRNATGSPDTQTLRYNWGDSWRYIEYNPYTGLVRQNASDIYGNHWSTWGYQAAGLDPTVAGTVLTNMVGTDQYGNHQQWHFTAKTETPEGTPYDRFATTNDLVEAIAAIPATDLSDYAEKDFVTGEVSAAVAGHKVTLVYDDADFSYAHNAAGELFSSVIGGNYFIYNGTDRYSFYTNTWDSTWGTMYDYRNAANTMRILYRAADGSVRGPSSSDSIASTAYSVEQNLNPRTGGDLNPTNSVSGYEFHGAEKELAQSPYDKFATTSEVAVAVAPLAETNWVMQTVSAAIAGADSKPTRIYNAAGSDALDDKGRLFDSAVEVAGHWEVADTVNGITTRYTLYYDGGTSQKFWRNGSAMLYYTPWTGTFSFSSGSGGAVEVAPSVQKDLNPTVQSNSDSMAGTYTYAGDTRTTSATYVPMAYQIRSTPYAHFALESMPDREYTNIVYAVGDVVSHAGTAYRCNTAIKAAEAWTPAHWDEIPTLAGVKNALSGNLYDFSLDADRAKALADVVRALGGSVTNDVAAAEEGE